MIVTAGEGTKLTLMLLRNGAPWIGQTVSVRVVDADGVEFTAATAAPETPEPGLYAVDWMPPEVIGQLVALWSSGFRTWSEAVEVRPKAPGGSRASDLIGILDPEGELYGIMESDDNVVGALQGDHLMAGIVETPEGLVVGVVESDDDVIGVFTEGT